MNWDTQYSTLDGDVPRGQGPGEVTVAPRAGHPLGPVLSVQPLLTPATGRLLGLGIGLAALALLGVSALLRPDPGEAGTHAQLGLPPCGFYVLTGLPCPTCGMTTAFAYAVRGQVLASIHAQVGGFLLALATAVTAVLGLMAAITGRRVHVNWFRVSPTGLVWLVALGFLAAWGLKTVLVLHQNGQAG